MSAHKEVVSVLVDNHSGVLTRISSLFSRRGYNIDSLTVSATDNANISRITLVVEGDERVLDQILSQTSKLEETRKIYALDPNHSLLRELLLIKVNATEENRGRIKEVTEIYGGKVVDLSVGSMVLELTGEPGKIDGFIELMEQYTILEMCRTGITAIERGGVRF